MWAAVCSFPVDLVATEILSWLELKDLINIESALVVQVSEQHPWRAAVNSREAIELEDRLPAVQADCIQMDS